MADQVIPCSVCGEKSPCEIFGYNWNGMQFAFMVCAGCYALLSYAALIELRALRNEIYDDMNKKEEASEEEEMMPNEDIVNNPPTVHLSKEEMEELREANEIKIDDRGDADK